MRDILTATAAELGAKAVLSSIWTNQREYAIEKFGEVCDLAKTFGLTVDLEYVPIAGVNTLAGAVDVLRTAQRGNAGLMIDANGQPTPALRGFVVAGCLAAAAGMELLALAGQGLGAMQGGHGQGLVGVEGGGIAGQCLGNEGGLAHFLFKLGHQQGRILGGKRNGVRLVPLATALAAPA